KAEKAQLAARQAPLGRKEATSAALIPIRKSAAWWALNQDERREIMEAKSHHISASLKYLPQVARQLYHCRDLGEPFDFLTWFEYAPEHAPQFEELVATLRDTEEWTFVEREKFSRIDARQLFDRPVVDIGPGIARAAVFQRDGKHLPQIFGRRRKAFAAGLIH
ncbi:hypothetical protein KXX12_008463, partial [Aspergillus fumigatus]